jgi:hypothetical protein
MEVLVKIVISALMICAFIACFVSFFLALHSFGRLNSTLDEPKTSKGKRALTHLIPFLMITQLVQPPERAKYARRLAYSLIVFLVCSGGLMLFLDLVGDPRR